MIHLFALVRAIHFLGLMAIFGAESLLLIFRMTLKDPPGNPLPRAFLLWAAIAALVTAFFWLVLASAEMSGGALFDPRAIFLAASATFFGHVLLARFFLLALLVAAVHRNAPSPVRIVLAGAALSAVALTSHTAASGDDALMALRAANDAIHLLAAGFWVGGLAVLVPLVLAHRKTPGILLPPLRIFSRWGTFAVALLIAAGAMNGYLILFATNQKWSFAYAGLLAAKIVLAALMVSLALVNRFHLLAGIRSGDKAAEETLAASVAAELATGIVVVLIAGLLGLLPPVAE